MIKWLGIAGAGLLLDQLTKYYVVSTLVFGERVQVLPFFQWVRWHNEGAAFSFLQDAGGWQRWAFSGLAVAFSAYLIYELSRLRKEELGMGWVFALILGGALGNLADRLTRGYVVDFIRFEYGSYGFPAFNVADSLLFCGAVLWIGLMWLERKRTLSDA